MIAASVVGPYAVRGLMQFVFMCCQCVARLETSCQPLALWQLKLLSAFYDRIASSDSMPSDSRLLTHEFLVSLQSRVETVLNQWVKSTKSNLVSFLFLHATHLEVVRIEAVIDTNVCSMIDIGDLEMKMMPLFCLAQCTPQLEFFSWWLFWCHQRHISLGRNQTQVCHRLKPIW